MVMATEDGGAVDAPMTEAEITALAKAVAAKAAADAATNALIAANNAALAVATTPAAVKAIIPDATPAQITAAIAATTPAAVKIAIPVAGVTTTQPTVTTAPVLPTSPSPIPVAGVTQSPSAPAVSQTAATSQSVTPVTPVIPQTPTSTFSTVPSGHGFILDGEDPRPEYVPTAEEAAATKALADAEAALAYGITAENAAAGALDPNRTLTPTESAEILDPANTGSPVPDTNWNPADAPGWSPNTGWPSPDGSPGQGGYGSPASVTTTTSATDSDGVLASLQAMLAPYGIDGIMDQIKAIREKFPQIKSDDILTLIQFDPAYNAPYLKRFSGNADLIKQGKQPLSMGNYIANESAYDKVFKSYGVIGLSSRDSYAKLIGGSVSPDEAGTRVNLAYTRVLNDPTTLGTFKEYYPTLSTGDFVSMMVDPANQLPELQKKVTAAEIGGVAASNAFTLSQNQANELGQVYGVTKDAARTGFSDIFQMAELGKSLPGDISGNVTQDEMLGVKFKDDAAATTKIKKVVGTRLAEYEAGGQMAMGNKGVAGLGSATRGT